MKLSEFKEIIREEATEAFKKSKQPINEGFIDKIIAFIVDKVIKAKYKKYFDALHNDPDYRESLKGLRVAVDKIDDSAARYEKLYKKSKQEYDEFVKKYGKEAADKVLNKTYSGKSYSKWRPKY